MVAGIVKINEANVVFLLKKHCIEVIDIAVREDNWPGWLGKTRQTSFDIVNRVRHVVLQQGSALETTQHLSILFSVELLFDSLIGKVVENHVGEELLSIVACYWHLQ